VTEIHIAEIPRPKKKRIFTTKNNTYIKTEQHSTAKKMNPLQITIPDYNPTAPAYASTGTPPLTQEKWIEAPKEFRTIGTQYERQPALKKKKSQQWKLTNLYRKAIKKHWLDSDKGKKAKRKLRKILKDIFSDKKMAWGHLKETGLAVVIMQLKKVDGAKDDDILKWAKGLLNLWKKKFNMRKIKIK